MALAMNMQSTGPLEGPRGETSLEADRRRAFVAARRHTVMVKTLRLLFPVGAAVVTAAYAVALVANMNFGIGNLRLGKVEVTSEDLTMKNPSYFGTTKDGGKFEVRAKRAVLAFNQNAPIKLFDIDGDMLQTNNVKTVVRAREGLFDNDKSELELFGGIEIDASNGMKARLSKAKIFSKENRIISDKPVHVSSPAGDVRGASMTMDTGTNRVAFVGQVTVRLAPTTPATATANPAKPVAATSPAFGRDTRQPIDVRSERFDVDDVAHLALFRGDVVATQGDSVLRAPELHISYEGKAAQEFANGTPGDPGEASGLSRMLARTGVVVTMGTDRRVSSDLADFDAKADTALFSGNVLVTQGKNTLQGRRLWLERKTGRTLLDAPAEAGSPAGRIAASFYQTEPVQPPAQKKSAISEVEAGAQNMLGTFKADPTAPMDVEADNLEVAEIARQATFRGAVKAQQGDFMVRAPEMVAFFASQPGIGHTSLGMGGADGKGAQISRIEARNKVVITSKEGQTATGDWATFDVKSNSVLMGGHVVVTRGKDVVQGPRLKIDLTTGMYRFDVDEKTAAAAAAAAQMPPPVAVAKEPPPPLTNRPCPPGRQCVLFYPQAAEDKAKEILKTTPGVPAGGWEPSTSASPVQRGN